MDIGLMVEGQDGLTWERWLHILALAERLGFPTLFRSDHYFTGGVQKDSLDTYTSLAVAARETTRMRFGPLVSPVTFRRPAEVGRMAAQIDLLSGGRFVLGVGNGWNEPEHRAYGIPFPPPGERTARLREAVELMRTMWGPGPASYSGHYYTLEDADPLPKPAEGRPWLLVGGSGPKRTLRLVAEQADEWNSISTTPEAYAEKNSVLSGHCEAVGRDPGSIKRTMMTFGLVGPDQKAVARATELAARVMNRDSHLSLSERQQQSRQRGHLVGTTEEIVEQLGRLAEVGVNEVQFQHFDFDDDAIPEFLAAEITPRVRDF